MSTQSMDRRLSKLGSVGNGSATFIEALEAARGPGWAARRHRQERRERCWRGLSVPQAAEHRLMLTAENASRPGSLANRRFLKFGESGSRFRKEPWRWRATI